MNRDLKLLGRVCLVLVLAEVMLVILSWLLSATMMEGVRSLLSSEGIRWFVGSYSAMMASPLLVWLLLLLSAYGCVQRSGVVSLFRRRAPITYRERIALRVAVIFLCIYVVIIALLTLMPHAILLSATGDLFPSAFSRCLVPIVAFAVILFAVAFAMMAGHISTLAAILQFVSYGIAKGAPLVVVLFLLIQFFKSVRFVFG